MLAISFGETGFDDALNIGQDQGHHPIKDRGHDQRFQVVELCASHFGGAPHQFMHKACCGDQRRVFCHGDKIIADGWDGEAKCLRQNDPPHGLSRGHAKCDGGFPLAFADGGQPGAEYFAHIGAIVKPERQYASPKSRRE